jgi:hypothetical protein
MLRSHPCLETLLKATSEVEEAGLLAELESAVFAQWQTIHKRRLALLDRVYVLIEETHKQMEQPCPNCPLKGESAAASVGHALMGIAPLLYLIQ